MPASRPERQDLYRGDWVINENWRATGKHLYYKRGPIQPYGSFVLGTNLPDYATKFPNNHYDMSGAINGSLNPTTVLGITFGRTHSFVDILPNNAELYRAGLSLFPRS